MEECITQTKLPEYGYCIYNRVNEFTYAPVPKLISKYKDWNVWLILNAQYLIPTEMATFTHTRKSNYK